MRIKYNVTIDDRVAFNLFYSKHSSTIRRMRIFWGTVFPIGYFLFFCLLGLYKREWSAPLFGLVTSVLLMLWVLAGRRRRLEKIVRKMLSEGSNKQASEEDELELTETGLIGKSRYEEGKIAWEALERIGFTPDYTFIFTGPSKGIPIAKARVIEGDYEGFTSQLKQTFESKLGTDRSPNISQRIIISPEKIYKEDIGFGRHSGHGIASFAISVAVYFFTFVALVIFSGIDSGLADRQSPIIRIVAVVLMLGFLANLTGLVLGITGIAKKNRKKVLAILGLVFNSIVLVAFIALIIIGRVMS